MAVWAAVPPASLNAMLGKGTVVSFDDGSVYIVTGEAQKAVPFADIVSLSKTREALNNRYFWRLEYRIGEATEVETFRPNNTLWNRNFPQFHARLREARPQAVKTPYHWWYF